MPNSYTQIYIHMVFATQNRCRLIHPKMQKEIYAYTAGIIKEMGCFVQCIGGMEDHIHVLFGLNPKLSLSEFAQKIKANTSRFINEKGWIAGKFEWQEGYGAFSVSQSGLEQARAYIANQEQHHSKQSFSAEYETLLERYRIDYDKRYVFQDPEE